MPKEELIGGLKNALDRGENLEKAIQSMVKAGYNPQEVNEAAKLAGRKGATAIISPEKEAAAPVEKKKGLFHMFGKKEESKAPAPGTPSPTEKAKPEEKVEAKKAIKEGKEKKKASKTIVIIIIALVVLTLIGVVALFLF